MHLYGPATKKEESRYNFFCNTTFLPAKLKKTNLTALSIRKIVEYILYGIVIDCNSETSAHAQSEIGCGHFNNSKFDIYFRK